MSQKIVYCIFYYFECGWEGRKVFNLLFSSHVVMQKVENERMGHVEKLTTLPRSFLGSSSLGDQSE